MKPKEVKDTPKKMKFTFPEGQVLEGTVIKEVGKLEKCGKYGDYYFVIQQIIYPDKSKTVRFGYYRKAPDKEKFIWGSQTTYHTSIEFTNELINKAKKEGIL